MNRLASNCLKALDQKRSGKSASADLVVEISLSFLNANFSKLLNQVGVGQSLAL